MKSVVIADDEASLRRLVTATIESDEYEVLEAADGDAAWQLIQERKPELVLLDVKMPGKTGLELARAIRAEGSLAKTRIILLTAFGQEADVRAGIEAGADLYLTKPFSPMGLLDAVEEALGIR